MAEKATGHHLCNDRTATGWESLSRTMKVNTLSLLAIRQRACDYIIRSRRELDMMPERPAVIKTIVTTDLAKNICERNGVPIFDVLTGFKYIGELAEKWHNTGGHSFIFGFEESYGYLAGDFVRDKDVDSCD